LALSGHSARAVSFLFGIDLFCIRRREMRERNCGDVNIRSDDARGGWHRDV
jgi:hypothetical protein